MHTCGWYTQMILKTHGRIASTDIKERYAIYNAVFREGRKD